jgi:hypothetical protein
VYRYGFLVSPIHDYSTLVNSIGIFLEIAGFVLIIIAIKEYCRTKHSDYVTGLDHVPSLISITNGKTYRIAIGVENAKAIFQFFIFFYFDRRIS